MGQINSNDMVDQDVADILSTFDHDKYLNLLNRINAGGGHRNEPYFMAYKYVEDLPFSELPKFVSHPSRSIRDIVNKRLAGVEKFRYMDS